MKITECPNCKSNIVKINYDYPILDCNPAYATYTCLTCKHEFVSEY